MHFKRFFVMLIIVIGIAAMTGNASAQTPDAAAAAPQSSEAVAATLSPLGTWEVTTTFPDGFRSKSIMTFAPGADPSMGSVFSTADIDFTFPVPCTNQQGVWSQTGGSSHVDLTFKGFCYNTSFEPFGRLKIQQGITLGPRGNGFTGKVHVELTRLDGSTEFAGDATVRAVRMVVEPLP